MIIAGLALCAILLSIVRETGTKPHDDFSFPFTAKKEITGDHVYSMADTTLRAMGISPKNIRPLKNRNDIRVLYPQGFDVLNFISAMKDSLSDYDAELYSVDNTKEKSSIVQIKNATAIIKSFIFIKEPPTANQKGVSPSVPKKTTRR